MSATILDTIVLKKEKEIAALPNEAVTPDRLAVAIQGSGARRDFMGALRRPHHEGCGLIAEVKKASPSAGIIRKDFDPIAIAHDYARAGADCLSVLTDVEFFQGSLDYLRQIRQAVSLPLLRKDFIIDERQILESAEAGADAILLIVAILDDARLRRFHDLAVAAGLAALVEVHDEDELSRALDIGAPLIGVNNRDLKTFKVNLATTERLAQRVWDSRSRSDTLLVAESGIHTALDVQRLTDCGAGAVLVGESLMRHADIPSKVRELMQRTVSAGGRRK